MWNGRKYAAMTIVGAGLAVAAATPASAWWWPFDTYGYSGDYSYVWPYTSYGYADYAPYGYVSYDYDYGPAYGYAGYGYSRPWGRVYGCGRAAYQPQGDNYAVADRRPAGFAVVSYGLHRPYAIAACASRSYRHVYAVAKDLNLAAKPVQNKVAFRVQNVKLAHNG